MRESGDAGRKVERSAREDAPFKVPLEAGVVLLSLVERVSVVTVESGRKRIKVFYRIASERRQALD